MKKTLSMILALAMIFMCCMTASAEETLVIGATGPLTGDYANYGFSMKRGAEIAANEINAAGGINGWQVKFIMEDDGGDAESAVNAYNVLMDEGMVASIGSTLSGCCLDVATESQADGILVLATTASMKECVQYDNCFRVCFTDPYQGVLSADFIADHEVATKVAIIYDKSNDYSVGITENFESEAAVRGLEVVTKQAFTNQSNTDFSVQLQACADSGAELVFLPIYAQEAAYVLTQAKSAGLETIFFGCDGLDGILGKVKQDVSIADNVLMLTPFAAESTEANVQSFVQAYKAAHGETPDQFAADAYDAVYAVKAAVEKAGSTSGDALAAAMTQIEVAGVTGTMTWSADGNTSKSASAILYHDGEGSVFGSGKEHTA